jgi:DNA-binding GntR family transcriptional regulator
VETRCVIERSVRRFLIQYPGSNILRCNHVPRSDPFDLKQHAGHRPVNELVYEAIREAICRGLLEPGERLVTEELSARMKVSRTPVREAIRKLESDGLVKSEPWRSVVVSEFPPLDEMEEFYAIRGAVEGRVAAFAARRRPRVALEQLEAVLAAMEAATRAGDRERFTDIQVEYYERYTALACSRRVHQILSSIQDYVARAKPISLARTGRMEEAMAELRAVYDAVVAGDEARAEALARLHCENAYAAYRAVIEGRTRGGAAP